MTTATITSKKITLATLKSFVRKSGSRLLINVRSKFDGMSDGCQDTGSDGFSPARATDRHCENSLGIDGAWLVLGGRDYIEAYEDGSHLGFRVSNCCGRFVLAVAK